MLEPLYDAIFLPIAPQINKQKKLLKQARKEKVVPEPEKEEEQFELDQTQIVHETIEEESMPTSPVKLSIFDMKKGELSVRKQVSGWK